MLYGIISIMKNDLSPENKKALCWMMINGKSLEEVYNVLSPNEQDFILEKAQNDYKYHEILVTLNRLDLFTPKIISSYMSNKNFGFDNKIKIIKNEDCRHLINVEIIELYFKAQHKTNFFRKEEDILLYLLFNKFPAENWELNKEHKLSDVLDNHPLKDDMLIYLMNNPTALLNIYISSSEVLLKIIEFSSRSGKKTGNVEINKDFACRCYFDFAENQRLDFVRFLIYHEKWDLIENIILEYDGTNSLYNYLRGVKRETLKSFIKDIQQAILLEQHKPSFLSIFMSPESNEKIEKKIKYYLLNKDIAKNRLKQFFIKKFVREDNNYMLSWIYQLECYSYVQHIPADKREDKPFFSDVISKLNMTSWQKICERDHRFWLLTPSHVQKKIRSFVKFSSSTVFKEKGFFEIKESDEHAIMDLCKLEISNIMLLSDNQFINNKDKIKDIQKISLENYERIELKGMNTSYVSDRYCQIMNRDELYDYSIKKNIPIDRFKEHFPEVNKILEKWEQDFLEKVYSYKFDKKKKISNNRYEINQISSVLMEIGFDKINLFFVKKTKEKDVNIEFLWNEIVKEYIDLLSICPIEFLLGKYKNDHLSWRLSNVHADIDLYINRVWTKLNIYDQRSLLLQDTTEAFDVMSWKEKPTRIDPKLEEYFLNEYYLIEISTYLYEDMWSTNFIHKAYKKCLEFDLEDETDNVKSNPQFNSIDMAIYHLESKDE